MNNNFDKLYESKLYNEDLKYVSSLPLPWDNLNGSFIMISGATGLIGSFLIDAIMMRNIKYDMNCRIYALSRAAESAHARFNRWWNNSNFTFVQYDVNKPLKMSEIDHVDFVLHLASNTHPVSYANDPIGTITTNVIGLKNMLDFCSEKNVKRFAFASSNEIYGENRGDTEKFNEEYCGYIDCNTLRAGYPESKRCGEALCQAYIKQRSMDIVIPRLTRSYGPTMRMSDTKAISQFIKKAINGEDIVLKSAGEQYYSFTYVADAVSGLLTVLLLGNNGEAYNIADDESDIRLKDLASLIAAKVGKNVIFEIPDELESVGYSKATKARLDSSKLQQLGWKAGYDITKGVSRTLDILRKVCNK